MFGRLGETCTHKKEKKLTCSADASGSLQAQSVRTFSPSASELCTLKSQNYEVIEQDLPVGFPVDSRTQVDHTLPQLRHPVHLPAGPAVVFLPYPPESGKSKCNALKLLQGLGLIKAAMNERWS